MDGNKETLQPYQNPHRNDEIDGIQKDTTFVEQTQKKTGLLTNLENTAYKLRHGRPLSPDITITTGEPKSPNNMETKTDQPQIQTISCATPETRQSNTHAIDTVKDYDRERTKEIDLILPSQRLTKMMNQTAGQVNTKEDMIAQEAFLKNFDRMYTTDLGTQDTTLVLPIERYGDYKMNEKDITHLRNAKRDNNEESIEYFLQEFNTYVQDSTINFSENTLKRNLRHILPSRFREKYDDTMMEAEITLRELFEVLCRHHGSRLTQKEITSEITRLSSKTSGDLISNMRKLGALTAKMKYPGFRKSQSDELASETGERFLKNNLGTTKAHLVYARFTMEGGKTFDHLMKTLTTHFAEYVEEHASNQTQEKRTPRHHNIQDFNQTNEKDIKGWVTQELSDMVGQVNTIMEKKFATLPASNNTNTPQPTMPAQPQTQTQPPPQQQLANQYTPNYNTSQTQNRQNNTQTCHTCGSPTHFVRNCPQNTRNNPQNRNNGQPPRAPADPASYYTNQRCAIHAGIHTNDMCRDQSHPCAFITQAMTHKHHEAGKCKRNRDLWYIPPVVANQGNPNLQGHNNSQNTRHGPPAPAPHLLPNPNGPEIMNHVSNMVQDRLIEHQNNMALQLAKLESNLLARK